MFSRKIFPAYAIFQNNLIGSDKLVHNKIKNIANKMKTARLSKSQDILMRKSDFIMNF